MDFSMEKMRVMRMAKTKQPMMMKTSMKLIWEVTPLGLHSCRIA